MPWRNAALIAPDSDLAMVEDEVRAVSAALRPVPLRNGVTTAQVTDLLTRQAWDVVWFACHGTRDGVQLSPENTLNTSTLIQLIRNSGARLLVLNTCESEQVAAWIYMQTDCAVICTVAEVGDTTAYVTGSLLARNLAQGMAVEEAFNRSKPGELGLSQRYRLFSRTYTPGQEMAKFMEMLTLANGPVQADIKELKDEVRAVREEMRTGQQVDPVRRGFWILGYLAFTFGIAVPLHELLPVVGQVYWRSLGVMAVLFGLAFAFLLYGMGYLGRRK